MSKDEDVVYVDEDGNPIELTGDEEFEYVEEEVEVEKGPSGLSRALNGFFHFLDRGGSLGTEIGAGIGMGLLAACVIFLNAQIVGNMLTADVQLANSPQNAENIAAAMTYVQLYVGAMLVSVLGTVAIGVAANLPLVQVSTLGLSGALLCLVEAGSGLTVENLLFVNLVAGVAYAVLALVPGVKSFVASAVPMGVKKGLAAACGAVFAYAALRVSGLVGAETISLGGGKAIASIGGVNVETAGMGLAALVGAVAAIAIFILTTVTKKGKPQLLSLLGGSVVFFGVAALTTGVDTSSTDSIANFGRVWLIAGSQASAQTPFADSFLTYAPEGIAAVFAGVSDVVSKGADFSAYSGNVVTLVVSGVLCYLFGSLLATEGNVFAVACAAGLSEDEAAAAAGRAKGVNALTNVVAPFLGAACMNVSEASVGAARDRARSGLASIFAAIVLLISTFVLIFPALFATTTYPVTSMMQWNYFAYGNGGFVYLVREVTMLVVDVVMVCVGVGMVVSALRRAEGVREIACAVVMAVVAAATLNVVAGAAAGLLVYLVLAVPARSEDPSVLPVSAVVLEVLLVAAVVLL